MRALLRICLATAALLALPLLLPRLAHADAANTAAVVSAANNFKATLTTAQQAFIDSNPFGLHAQLVRPIQHGSGQRGGVVKPARLPV